MRSKSKSWSSRSWWDAKRWTLSAVIFPIATGFATPDASAQQEDAPKREPAASTVQNLSEPAEPAPSTAAPANPDSKPTAPDQQAVSAAASAPSGESPPSRPAEVTPVVGADKSEKPPPAESLPPLVEKKNPFEMTVSGKRIPPPSRGASDFHVEIGALSSVPRKNAAELLKLVPGILLTNDGSEAHADQVFLRGFDAREGQDIEFTVGGVPVNELSLIHI